jgi:hypothetical protein
LTTLREKLNQNRCKGHQSRPVCRVSDGRGGDPTAVVRRDHAANRCLAIAVAGSASMTPGESARGNDGRGVCLWSCDKAFFSTPRRRGLTSCPNRRLGSPRDPENRRDRPVTARIRPPYGEPPVFISCALARLVV